ncbi:MAG: hypothetical protein CL489_06255 [Acidobacteria bacterium]|nr:hypothetical protein [Acidobacteriota bacterium]|tara:strand:- start:38249 stop:38536 length:288 start_codon:yes stop_codon:yes gene_type:complete
MYHILIKVHLQENKDLNGRYVSKYHGSLSLLYELPFQPFEGLLLELDEEVTVKIENLTWTGSIFKTENRVVFSGGSAEERVSRYQELGFALGEQE